MKIGNVEINHNVFLAPMAGITDRSFRVLCKRQGCGLTYTEMVSAKGLYYKSENTAELLEIAEEERPAAVQLFGSEPAVMALAAREVEARGAEMIDINMGCPTPKIVRNGDGCALMLKPKLAGEIIESVVSAVKVPVTVKMRKGWDEGSANAVEVASIAEACGAAAVAVHGRTREQFYSGAADWGVIRAVKAALKIPVIGNGDVFTPADASRMLETTGCDAVMVGRGAQGNPWVFGRILEYLDTGNIPEEPGPREKIEMVLRHIDMIVAHKGENVGVKEMRKHIAWYLKGMPGCTRIKSEINSLVGVDRVKNVLREYLESI